MLKVRALKKKAKHFVLLKRDEQEIGISKNNCKTITSDDDVKDDNGSPEKERKPAKKKGAHHKTESNKGLEETIEWRLSSFSSNTMNEINKTITVTAILSIKKKGSYGVIHNSSLCLRALFLSTAILS